ncbi:phosphatidylinositol glycan anchor biosynthesis class U protein [Phlebotomus argentipes]|uniref:phosphatidylinositol glycan anchor biosynthesis class U protein n=1 Tax=Phlebotomus argentipes TaxID=94469 RepID=UPI00289311D9|nr:phosphatidylinositol glycan anchor biosynthesis class U protein [Phlebotomus argentipes]
MKMSGRVGASFLIAGSIRYLLMCSTFASYIRDRVEVSTPLNSWKRVLEGAYLHENGVDPYSGDMYHENPLILVTTNVLIKHLSAFIPHLFVAIDLLAAAFIFGTAKIVARQLMAKQKREQSTYAKGTEELQLLPEDQIKIPLYCTVAYLLNPYSILNCVGQTTTVWSNCLLAAFFFFMARRQIVPAVLLLVLETQRNFYPAVLIVPLAIDVYRQDGNGCRRCLAIRTVVLFVIGLVLATVSGYLITERWTFLDATYGFILNHRDLQPNIGLFWYFFTEMFDHFRDLFIWTFQINATVLYLAPLALKLRHEPLMLATVLTGLGTIFRSYPCIGDVALYMSLLPMWKFGQKFMSHKFIVGCFFLITSVLGPVVWHLWIYSASANANFYFGVTLAFATAQIFLVTDLLFAYIKRDFCLKNGLTFTKDGKEGKMTLE